ncbi:hypothetical protein NQ315_005702 [Exocentrus adspersus]|uniref:Uncharacterized protein n=1 Tax=Exocentrus adspersus TaxID=1586481 RepID=A0AAV8VIE3_9CUCU|nr:hypothetical protein NQ315_005702 [Exocentrus adspersus]
MENGNPDCMAHVDDSAILVSLPWFAGSSQGPPLCNIENNIFDQEGGIVITPSYPGCKEVIREAFVRMKLPESTLATAIESLSQATLKQYNSTYKTWWEYCCSRNLCRFTAEVPQVLSYLQEMLDKKIWKYGTFNTSRSALSLILPGNVGSDLRIRRFLKGIQCVPKSLLTIGISETE